LSLEFRMQTESLIDFLKNFKTGEVLGFLRTLNIEVLIHDPWFLGGTAALALISLIMRWRVLLATILSVTGFVGLLNYTLQQDTSLENLSNPTLMVFVGGGVLIIFVVIYLLFIKE
jgi:hypothetical protein